MPEKDEILDAIAETRAEYLRGGTVVSEPFLSSFWDRLFPGSDLDEDLAAYEAALDA